MYYIYASLLKINLHIVFKNIDFLKILDQETVNQLCFSSHGRSQHGRNDLVIYNICQKINIKLTHSEKHRRTFNLLKRRVMTVHALVASVIHEKKLSA